MSPILNILKNENLEDDSKHRILKFLFENAIDIDIDSHRKYNTRALLKEKIPDLDLKSARKLEKLGSSEENAIFLVKCLRNSRESDFLKKLNFLFEYNDEKRLNQLWEYTFVHIDNDALPSRSGELSTFTLLSFAVKKGRIKAVNRMLRLGADINFKPGEQSSLTPIEHACCEGFPNILRTLLRSTKMNAEIHELISLVLAEIGISWFPKEEDYKICLSILLNSPKLDVDGMCSDGHSLLEKAIMYDNRKCISSLLDKGAFLGQKTVDGEYCLSYINPKFLKQYLDDCVELKGSKYSKIRFDYKNFVPVSYKQDSQPTRATRKRENGDSKPYLEMHAIHCISQTSDLRHLLEHALIQSFLSLKWQQWKFSFHLNIFTCFMFITAILLYTFLYYLNENDVQCMRRTKSDLSWWLLLLTTAAVPIHRIYNFIALELSYKRWLYNILKNYSNMPFIVGILLLINTKTSETSCQWVVIVPILLCLWLPLILMYLRITTFEMNIYAYCILSSNILCYVFLFYLDANVSATNKLLFVLSIALSILIVVREIYQFIFSMYIYFKSSQNLLEIALLGIVVIILGNYDVSEVLREELKLTREEMRGTVAVIAILLITAEVIILLGCMEIFSIHFIILKSVVKGFFDALKLYVIILVAFALCFFALLKDPNKRAGDRLDDVPMFSMKIFEMLTGELSSGDVKYDKNVSNYLLFLAFLAFGTTILFNLLHGLAIYDIQVCTFHS